MGVEKGFGGMEFMGCGIEKRVGVVLLVVLLRKDGVGYNLVV